MTDRRLQVFTTVAKLLSFTKAAGTLRITQPAVTFQIHQLEEYFNTRLFDRTHNHIQLTEAGRVVKIYADQIIALYSEMDNEVHTLTGDVQGQLSVGASTTIGEYIIPEIVGAYQSMFQHVKACLNIANTACIIHMVENNEIDIGIVEGPVNNKNLTTTICWNDELILICPPDHALSKQSSVKFEDIFKYPFISREEGSGTREVLQKALKSQNIALEDLNISMELSSPESIKNAVAAGLGLSIISVATIQKEIMLNSLNAIPLAPPIKRPFSIIYQRQKFRLQVIATFLEFLHKKLQSLKLLKNN